jgi:hypothetical protein
LKEKINKDYLISIFFSIKAFGFLCNLALICIIVIQAFEGIKLKRASATRQAQSTSGPTLSSTEI